MQTIDAEVQRRVSRQVSERRAASTVAAKIPLAATPPAPRARPELTAQQWQQRIQALVVSPLAWAREELALTLCLDTAISIDVAQGCLQASQGDRPIDTVVAEILAAGGPTRVAPTAGTQAQASHKPPATLPAAGEEELTAIVASIINASKGVKRA